MSDITDHKVASVEITTHESGDTKWLKITSYDRSGNMITEYTMFADEDKAIQLFLGERE